MKLDTTLRLRLGIGLAFGGLVALVLFFYPGEPVGIPSDSTASEVAAQQLGIELSDRIQVPAEFTTPPKKALEQDFLRTMDPELGYPPYEFALEEIAYQHALKRSGFDYRKSANPLAASITWSDRGPNNIGGRTRGLAWDPNDPSGNKVWAGGVAGGLWYNNNITLPGSQWQNVDDLWENLGVTSIAFDPTNTQIMYVGTGEGFFNGGSNTRGAGIYKSTDGGQTFARIPGTETMFFISDLIVRDEGGTGVLYVGVQMSGIFGVVFTTQYYAGLWRSTDGGANFTQVLPELYAVADLELAANNRIYVGTMSDYGYLYGAPVSSDGDILFSDLGTTGSWTINSQYRNNNFITRIELATAPSDSNRVYAMVAQPEGGASDKVVAIGVSTNGGTSFTNMPEPDDVDNGIPADDFSRGQAGYDLILGVDPNNANRVIAGTINLHMTSNGNLGAAASWSQISKWSNNPNMNLLNVPLVHADQHAIAWHPSRAGEVLFGTDGGVFWTSNISSNNILARNFGYNVTQFYTGTVTSTGTEIYMAGAQDNGTNQMTGNGISGANPSTEYFGGDGAYCFIEPGGSRTIASYVYNSFVFGGLSFPSIYLVNNLNSGSFINPAEADWVNNRLYSGESSGQIRRTDIPATIGSPAGLSTALFVPDMLGTATCFTLSPASTLGNSVVLVGTNQGRVYRLSGVQTGFSVDQVVDITGSGFPTGNRTVTSIAFGATANDIVVTFGNYGTTSVWLTRNGGTTWEAKDNGSNLPNIPIRWAAFNPSDATGNMVLLATETGVYLTEDISVANPVWTPCNTGLANVRTDMLRYRPSTNTMYAFTHGRGVFSAPMPIVTSNEPAARTRVANLRISPNPSSEVARVSGELLEASAIEIEVRDLQGRKLDARSLTPRTSFNETFRLNSYAKGIYVVRVVTEGGEEARRLVVN